jgi:hypothetical protein
MKSVMTLRMSLGSIVRRKLYEGFDRALYLVFKLAAIVLRKYKEVRG